MKAQSLRAQTKGSSGAEHTSAGSRKCAYLQEAATKVSDELPHLAAELMSAAHVVARDNNLPRAVFKGISGCVSCGYPVERATQASTPCKLCDYKPCKKRKRSRRASRSKSIAKEDT
mmetsp:Transcript_10398/g.37631  ORF Transcript_10398/g.37631 Transcript_10398/m.37631 type:complete len:117 (+) Transcript_10398:103-453(+)